MLKSLQLLMSPELNTSVTKHMDNKSEVGSDKRTHSTGRLQQVELRHRELATRPLYHCTCSSKAARKSGSFCYLWLDVESYISGK